MQRCYKYPPTPLSEHKVMFTAHGPFFARLWKYLCALTYMLFHYLISTISPKTLLLIGLLAILLYFIWGAHVLFDCVRCSAFKVVTYSSITHILESDTCTHNWHIVHICVCAITKTNHTVTESTCLHMFFLFMIFIRKS